MSGDNGEVDFYKVDVDEVPDLSHEAAIRAVSI